jgi:pSer/pThr/pTyr-binding forkhead associated (FHA) protein
MRAQLIPLDGGSPIEIARDLTLVGRQENCDLRLDHKSVSKLHCVLVKTDGLLLLRDLGSTNGTRVNGQRVRRAALLPNDQLFIASYKFRVYLGPDEPSAVAAPPNERTQHMDAKELAGLLAQPAADDEPGEESEQFSEAVQPNQLPDVYPEDEEKPRK